MCFRDSACPPEADPSNSVTGSRKRVAKHYSSKKKKKSKQKIDLVAIMNTARDTLESIQKRMQEANDPIMVAAQNIAIKLLKLPKRKQMKAEVAIMAIFDQYANENNESDSK
jgi:hypothetical protein